MDAMIDRHFDQEPETINSYLEQVVANYIEVQSERNWFEVGRALEGANADNETSEVLNTAHNIIVAVNK